MTRRELVAALLAWPSLARAGLPGPSHPLHATTVAEGATVGDILPPPGALARGNRHAPADPWAAFLRALPLRPPGTPVLDYGGRVVGIEPLRVVDMPLVRGDLQQCADSILRLRATFLRAAGQDPAFRYTSGWLSKWSAWAAGQRPVVKNDKVTVNQTGKVDDSDANFEAWLRDLFTYAGTISLKQDTRRVGEPGEFDHTSIVPGDVVLYAGSPGHAVLVLDVAWSREKIWALVGQGFMPAMDFHLCPGPDAGWFHVHGDYLETSPLAVPWSGHRRFK